ncbi:hypothetical protein ACFW08_37265 [Streptomyces sp. NPDC058960]|uniref:hypothetical protein n=1 Tax=Streptomyces sp. NPDC058960 TaxID=3346679 RepID=UPI0036844CBD
MGNSENGAMALTVVGDPMFTADDVDELEAELLLEWWEAAARTEPGGAAARRGNRP